MARHLRTHLLIGIPLAATLLVGAASVYLYYVFFPPRFSGWGEVTAGRSISGWVVDRAGAGGPVEVQLYVDERFAAHRLADLPRPDVAGAGWTKDPRCGYSFGVPSLAVGEHEARVYAVHKVGGGAHVTLQATGHPLRFRVDSDGAVRPLD
jgi:hypothetical protein